MKTLCQLARVFKAQRHKRVTMCNRVTSAQNWKYQLTQCSLKSNVKAATMYTAVRQKQNFANVQAHFTSTEKASRLYMRWQG